MKQFWISYILWQTNDSFWLHMSWKTPYLSNLIKSPQSDAHTRAGVFVVSLLNVFRFWNPHKNSKVCKNYITRSVATVRIRLKIHFPFYIMKLFIYCFNVPVEGDLDIVGMYILVPILTILLCLHCLYYVQLLLQSAWCSGQNQNLEPIFSVFPNEC